MLQGTDRVEDYLPRIWSRFEGTELECYSSLLNLGELDHDGGYRCQNVVIRGKGTIASGGRILAERVIASERERLKDYLASLGEKIKECEKPETIPGRVRPRLINMSNCRNCLLYTSMGAEGKGVYNVNFSVRSTEYYYFYFDPQDGTLLGASSSLAADMDADAVSYAVLEGKMEKMCKTAKAVLTGKLQKEAEYEKIVCAYRDENGYLGSFNRIAYYFIRKDGSAYKIAMNAAREAFLDYAYIEDYGAYIQEQNPQTAEKSKNPNSGQGKTVYVEMGK